MYTHGDIVIFSFYYCFYNVAFDIKHDNFYSQNYYKINFVPQIKINRKICFLKENIEYFGETFS